MNHEPPHRPDAVRLSPEDARALDAALGELSLPADADRAQRVSAVLSLLDRWPTENASPELVASLLARLEAARRAPQMPATVCDADAAVLDALLAAHAAGGATGPMPPDSAERAAAVTGVVGLFDRWQAPAVPTDLAQRTLQRVEQARRRESVARLPQDRPGPGRLFSVGLRQFGSVAALVLISMSLLVPVLSKARTDAEVASCKANLGRAGSGLYQYANDHLGAMPLGSDRAPIFSELMEFAEDADGQSLPSSAVHMLVLPREGYLREEQLACTAANASLPSGGRYSAQAIEGSRALRLSSLEGPVMADTNPLYLRRGTAVIRQAGWDATASMNHRGTGQNVLLSNGSVMWTLHPVVQHHDTDDNIWLRATDPPRPQESSARVLDAFLTP
ncbi:MAG: hypothetical protein ACIAXF_02290 [Phycisphaerales bacterium JB063]